MPEITPETVTALLEALGSTPDDVAASLRFLGHRGRPRSPCHCPVANYLRAAGVTVPEVADSVVFFLGDEPRESGAPSRVGTTPAVFAFVNAFDEDTAYPDLVQR